MAGDWIKMRVALDRDPKVLWMADYLAEQREFMDWLTDPVRRTCEASAYEHVTRNVTVALCVTALLVTWGAAREQGKRESDDLVLGNCSIDLLSALAGLPCFGQAMASVGWVIEDDGQSVRFPKFFAGRESPSDRHRAANAERQARYRRRNGVGQAVTSNVTSNVTRNVTSNVTITRIEEKRREEKKNTIQPPIPPASGGLGGDGLQPEPDSQAEPGQQVEPEGQIQCPAATEPNDPALAPTETPPSEKVDPGAAGDAHKPSAFDAFWAEYPRKVGKLAARRSWDRAKGRPPLDQIIAAVRRSVATEQWRRDSGQFIPNPATWINQGRWDDQEPASANPEEKFAHGF
jgi:hypothetical protein